MISYGTESIKYVKGMTYEQFCEDERNVVYAVFNLSQLGELVKKLDKNIRDEYINIPWHELSGLRNRIVHDYDGIKLKIIWNVLNKEAPLVISNLKDIKSELVKN
jgi:uncharacterized protein with HEPN domain